MVHEDYRLEGSKGGEEKAHTPVETPNNLLSIAYAKVLVAVAEGELPEEITGKQILLAGTPLLNDAGQENFGGVTWEWRRGTQDQTYIQGMPEVSNEINVGVEIKNTTPWTRQITKTSLDAYRLTIQWPALLRQETNGDTNGVTVDYAVDLATDGGPFKLYKEYQVSGKTNNVYEKTIRIDLPKSETGWTIRLRRLTGDNTNSLIQDKMNLKSYAEVVDAKFSYPNTALLFVQFDSRLFGGGSIPKISVRTKGRIVRVPDNYDPETRTYTGVWSGAFKWAYSNNPAWVFFDIVTQDRFGLGNRVTADQVDKWELYEVAQYCDVLVDDGTGAGTKEPRHTCNMYIQSKAEAWRVLRDICSIFNGMTYWNGTKFIAVADKLEPLDNIPLFSRSNVIDGKFRYSSTDERTIFTSALISYDEPTDHFGSQIEAVWESSEILRWQGDRQTQISAIGCTSRGEAQRKGKYTLLTNMRNRSVTFKTGLQGMDEKVAPGRIIGIADPLISGKSFTGRLIASTATVVTLDRPTEAKAGDLLYVTLTDGSTQGRTIKSVANGTIVQLTTAYSKTIALNSVWYLESSDLKSQLYKVLRVSDDDGIFEINCIEYDPSKYAAVDNGARLEERPISKVPPSAQKAPTPITVSSHTYTEQTMAVTNLTISWPKVDNALLYEGEWRVGQGDWVQLGTTGALEFNLKGVYTGNYVARVRAINALNIKSVWSLSETTPINGKTGAPPALASLTASPLVYGIRTAWAFKDGSEDTARTEVMWSKTPSFANATKLGDFAYPQNLHDINGLAAGQTFYFWARIVDRTGNVGPYFPASTANGVQGIVSTDVALYDEYFVGMISESALDKNLHDKIEKIEVIEGDVTDLTEEVKQLDLTLTALDGKVELIGDQVEVLETTVVALDGSVNWLESQLGGIEAQLQNDIFEVNKNLQQAIDITNTDLGDLKDDVNELNSVVEGLELQVGNIVDALLYNPDKAYKKGNSVREGQVLYQAVKDVPVGVSPPNPEYWKAVGDIITDANALAAQVSLNSTSITNQGNVITAQGQQLNALDIRVGTTETGLAGNTTAINNLQATVTTQGNTITSQGQDITSLKSDVTSLQTGQQGNASAIESLRTTVTQQGNTITTQGQAITSLGTDVKALQTDVSGVKSDLSAQGTAITGLTTTVTQQGNTISSHTNSITALESSLALVKTDINGLKTDVAANSTAVTNLQNTVTTQGNTITAQGQEITTLKATVTTHTTDIDGLKTTVTGQGTAITNLQTTVTQQGKDITANSNSITQLATEVHFQELNGLYEGDETDQQIGEALQIAYGAASATESLTSEVTKQGGQITANAQSITELKAELSNIDGDISGNASAIENLKATVTSQGNTITSNSNSITSLNNSLVVTNNNVAGVKTTADKAAADAASALVKVETKADASAVTALATRVTNAEGKIVTQGESITTLNNSLTITNQNVTKAQNAADEAKAIAITKADASAVTSLTTRVEAAEGTITSQGQAITSLNNSLVITNQNVGKAQTAADEAKALAETKADSSALTALTSTVTQQGTQITANSGSITSLNASLATTNQNVTAAQDAANAANTLAGGKGKVFFQNGEPPAAERLTQNLWIDTTGGANTPKRWNGTAWVAVTDKVALDAAAAAKDALEKVETKADASAVTELKGTVTQQGLDIAANTSSITTLATEVHFNELNGLYEGDETDQQISEAIQIASGAALAAESLTSSVVSLDGKVTAQAQSLTELSASLTGVNNTVAANGTAINRLDTITTTQGNTIASQGQSITSLNNSLVITNQNVTAAQGTANEAKALAETKADASAVASLTTKVTSLEGTVTTQGQSITSLNNSLVVTNQGVADAKADAANALSVANSKADASAVASLTTRVTNAEGVLTTQGQSIVSLNNSLVVTNQNVTNAKNAADEAKALAETKADASALTALTNTVTQQGQTITSQAGQITSLNTSLATTNTNVGKAQTAADDALALAKTKADASVVAALQGTVTQHGTEIAANTSSITTLATEVHFQELNGLYEGDETDQQISEALQIASGAALAAQSLTSSVDNLNGKVTAQAQQLTELSASLTDVSGQVVGTGAAIARLNTITTAQGNDITSQGQSITSLNNSLVVTNANVTAAQTTANEAKTLAETKADASAVASLTTKVTSLEGTVTTQGQSITSLNNSLVVTNTNVGKAQTTADEAKTLAQTKADASAVTALTTRVTSVEGTVTTQGQSITSLNNSLVTTNQNVTAAQNAANAANTLAGGKGKVIVQNAAPAVADQLAQNLWIDTTANANTPKRWNGTAWTAVTDKVATDAAAAAANALSVANSKADASAVTSLTTRVTNAEGTLTTQGNSITSLNNSLVTTNTNVTAAKKAADDANTLAGGKGKVFFQATAPAAADRLEQNLWIDTASGANTPKRWNGTAWVAVTDKIATDAAAAAANALNVANGKADAAAVTSLTTRVTAAEGKITSQGESITSLTSRVTAAETGVSGNAAALTQTNIKVTALDGKVEATSTKVDTLQAGVESNTAAVQQTSQAVADLDGKASAMWSVKLQVNSQNQYVMAGIGVGIENGPAGLQGTVLISADKFAVVNGLNATTASPFVVNNGQVFINDLFVANGSINMLKIGDNLQSDDYVAGQKGWKLSKGGNIEFNGTVAGGGRLTMTNQLIQVFDTNNVLRVRMGIWG